MEDTFVFLFQLKEDVLSGNFSRRAIIRNHHFSFTPITSFPNYLVISFSCACINMCVCMYVHIFWHMLSIYTCVCGIHTYSLSIYIKTHTDQWRFVPLHVSWKMRCRVGFCSPVPLPHHKFFSFKLSPSFTALPQVPCSKQPSGCHCPASLPPSFPEKMFSCL